MTEQNRTTPARESASPEHTRTLDERLGLRPRTWSQHGKDEPHPDTRPCPPWCWAAAAAERHEVDPDAPLTALHELDEYPTIMASRYKGFHTHNLERVNAAELDIKLFQRGQAAPTISLWRRRQAEHTSKDWLVEERLRLSIQDAWDLITALTYVTSVAEGVVTPGAVD